MVAGIEHEFAIAQNCLRLRTLSRDVRVEA
jgi:hypothetical protein